jgi:hypothetical protein
MRSFNKIIITVLLGLLPLFHIQAGEKIRASVSYISASVVYLDAGRDAGFAVGDTVEVLKEQRSVATLVITAVSRKSSAAQVISSIAPLTVGDQAISVKEIEQKTTLQIVSRPADTESTKTSIGIPSRTIQSDQSENIVTGRLSLQYSGMRAEDSRFNLSQPAPLLRLTVRNISGTGLEFSLYTRSYYDLTSSYQRYGGTSRLKTRLYEFQFQHDQPDDQFG